MGVSECFPTLSDEGDWDGAVLLGSALSLLGVRSHTRAAYEQVRLSFHLFSSLLAGGGLQQDLWKQ